MALTQPDLQESQFIESWLNIIADICQRAAVGDLEARLIGAPEHPALHRAVVAINAMLDQTDAFVREARVSLDAASHGRFHRRFLLRGMKGSFRNGAYMINQANSRMAAQASAIQDSEQQRLNIAGQFEATVRLIAQNVADSALVIQQLINRLSQSASKTTEDAIDVANASALTSRSVQNVAAATDQLAVAFGEIEKQAYDSAKVANEAASSADKINTVIAQLNDASTKIGGVIRIISQIARQTNLLALNATIEAARSGEAGRGFAVVASEVKHLAQQTASATEEIQSEVDAIQGAAAQTATAISGIGSTIHSVNDISKLIAMSVNSQREATSEISKSVQEAAEGSQSVSTAIGGVSQSARTASESADQLRGPAETLLSQSAQLSKSIDEFLQVIRSRGSH